MGNQESLQTLVQSVLLKETRGQFKGFQITMSFIICSNLQHMNRVQREKTTLREIRGSAGLKNVIFEQS